MRFAVGAGVSFAGGGEDDCDGGQQYVVYADYDDQRLCSPCTCNLDDIECGRPSYALLRTTDCSPNFGPHPRFDGACWDFTIAPGENDQWSFRQERSPLMGQCSASTSRGIQNVVGRAERRLCCYPPSAAVD